MTMVILIGQEAIKLLLDLGLEILWYADDGANEFDDAAMPLLKQIDHLLCRKIKEYTFKNYIHHKLGICFSVYNTIIKLGIGVRSLHLAMESL